MVTGPGHFGRGLEQIAEQVDVVVGMHALHHRGQPLQAGAGVDRGLGERCEFAARRALELHEHQVPDLHVAVPVLVGRARRAAGHFGPVVVEDLAAGAAGAGVAHRPEIRLLAHARHARGGHARLIDPQFRRLVIVAVYRDVQSLRIELELAGHELPGEADRLALEVLAEREVAQHLEEGVVAGGVPDVLQIVVLAAGAYAALAGGRARVAAFLLAQEHVLERHHAGVGEQQRRIIPGHQAKRRARSCGRAP